ncbi:hypothetical protein ACIQUB_07910 [Rhizobium sp. NPDC090275]|uniref:hypothetical protein n=1 Tax=Rhizobium sp. NPDC090275 TaxID=3364498 RepID=UPI00383B4423
MKRKPPHLNPVTEAKNSESELLALGASSYLLSLRSEISQLLANTDEGLRQKLGKVYKAAVYLREDKDQWQSFCERDEWQSFKGRPKINDVDRSDALRYAIRFAVGFDGAKSNSTVHRYNRALGTLWKSKVPAQDVPRLLAEEGGVEKMKRTSAKATISLRLLKNRVGDQLDTANYPFEAFVYIRFSAKDGRSRNAEILAGTARRSRRPSFEAFNNEVLTWQKKEEKRLKAAERQPPKPL